MECHRLAQLTSIFQYRWYLINPLHGTHGSTYRMYIHIKKLMKTKFSHCICWNKTCSHTGSFNLSCYFYISLILLVKKLKIIWYRRVVALGCSCLQVAGHNLHNHSVCTLSNVFQVNIAWTNKEFLGLNSHGSWFTRRFIPARHVDRARSHVIIDVTGKFTSFAYAPTKDRRMRICTNATKPWCICEYISLKLQRNLVDNHESSEPNDFPKT